MTDIGQFTVVDHFLVSEEDLGNNYFVDRSHLGTPRAQAVIKLLCDLNENVKGHAIVRVRFSLYP